MRDRAVTRYTEHMNLHAHVDSTTVDCDGPTHTTYSVGLNESEVAESQKDGNDFSDIHFMHRVMMRVVSVFAIGATVRIDKNGFDYSEATEEGHIQVAVRWCASDCDLEMSSYRDVYAEGMNY